MYKCHIVVGHSEKLLPEMTKVWCGKKVHETSSTLNSKLGTCLTCVNARNAELGQMRKTIKDRLGV